MTKSVPSPTVFVVDDDPEMRKSLVMLIQAMGHEVDTFCSGPQFRNYYKADMPGCLLSDIQMPRQTGLELYEDLLQTGRRLPVIFMTAHANVTTAVAAMKTGAIEFLEKPFGHATLAKLLDKALALDSQWRSKQAELAEVESQINSLTSREQETLQLILEGLSNKVMAKRQAVTERAIEMRRARIMQKLGVRSVPELLNVAVTHRVLSEVNRLHSERNLFG